MIEADAGKAQEGEGQTGLPTDARAAGTTVLQSAPRPP